MGMLEYSVNVKKRYETHELLQKYLDTFQLERTGALGLDSAFWYHAFCTYSYLGDMERKNEELAAEIRRLLFKKMKGEEVPSGEGAAEMYFILPDRSCYSSFTDNRLLDKMVVMLQEYYKKWSVTEDYGIADKIQRTPFAFKMFLLGEVTSRDNLIRMSFALELSPDEFNTLLKKANYRELSPAVPRDLIILYCISNRDCCDTEVFNWETVNRLQKEAEKFQNNPGYIQSEDQVLNATKKAKEVWLPQLQGKDESEFIEHILKPCCWISAGKIDANKNRKQNAQFSQAAYDIFRKYSIVTMAENGGLILERDKRTVFLRENIEKYMTELKIPDCYKFLKKKKKGENEEQRYTLSVDEYCRFLYYRVMLPNESGKHNMIFYCMDYGRLPHLISGNLLRYDEVNGLIQRKNNEDAEKITNRPKNAHVINRYDILTVMFYYSLFRQWQSGKFKVDNQIEAEKLRVAFSDEISEVLDELGYSDFSCKNPFDVLLRMCFLSPNPLECFNRVLELNVLDSLASNVEGNLIELPKSTKNLIFVKIVGKYDEAEKAELLAEFKRDFGTEAWKEKKKEEKSRYKIRYYPSKERIESVLNGLEECVRDLFQIANAKKAEISIEASDIVMRFELLASQILDFCGRIKKRM